MQVGLNGQSISELAPCLVQAVATMILKRRMVHEALQAHRWVRDITGAITVQVILEYLQVWDLVTTVALHCDTQDRALWRWTPNQQFSTASAYQAFFIGQYATPGAKVMWRTRAPNKCKFFLWLALHDRCWTADRRKRHGLQPDDICVLCHQESETIIHLLTSCTFSLQIWSDALAALGLQNLTPSATTETLADWWTSSRKRVTKEGRKLFDSLTVLICWHLWLESNARTFHGEEKTAPQLLRHITEEASVWVRANYSSLDVFV